MKRDFKGISVETGKWVYGLPFSMDFSGKVTHIQDKAHFYAIKPETLSECTGRRDVKGTMIYENDILSLNFESEEYRYVVKFDNDCAGFIVNGVCNEEGVTDDLTGSDDKTYGFCVIGNVFENPELTKKVQPGRPDYPDDDRPDYLDDEHCCEYNADGMCEICGAVRPGSPLYLEIYGGE